MQARNFLVILLLSILFTLSYAEPLPYGELQEFANSMAELIFHKQDEKIFEHTSSIMKKVYTKDQLIKPLDLSRKLYGQITSYQPKIVQPGFRVAGIKTLGMVRYWYAIKTSLNPDGCFLQIDVRMEDEVPVIAGYAIVRFIGNKIPDDLK